MQITPCTHPAFESGVIPVVRRHAEDAAFYWKQIDTSLSEPGLSARRAQHFAELLASHLEGLGVAGNTALAPSLEAFERWRKPGEAFVAFYCALRERNGEALARVLGGVSRNPSLLLRGAISALVHAPDRDARAWIDERLANTAPDSSADLVAAVAALRACALRGWDAPAQDRWMGHESHFVRAAACRAASPAVVDGLLLKLDDDDMAVRAEASIRLAQTLPSETDGATAARLRAAGVLWLCVAAQAQLCAEATGLDRMLAHRRLTRWLRHLAWSAPQGHADVDTLLEHLPRRAGLTFALFHADPRLLPFVFQAMGDSEHARWAGWVWQGLTGVDLRSAGLAQPEPETVVNDAPLAWARQDADQGLALPDRHAVVQHPAMDLAKVMGRDERVLMGRPIKAQELMALLALDANQAQVVRAVAAHAWNSCRFGNPIALRASAATLLRQEAALQSP
jgi:hypothetical protein